LKVAAAVNQLVNGIEELIVSLGTADGGRRTAVTSRDKLNLALATPTKHANRHVTVVPLTFHN
jgi:hypothetical protein